MTNQFQTDDLKFRDAEMEKLIKMQESITYKAFYRQYIKGYTCYMNGEWEYAKKHM